MATLTDRERALRMQLKADLVPYAAGCLNIRTKAGAVERFKFNRTQLELHRRIGAQLHDRGKVRALVLKGRQVGISTYVAGRFYWKTTHRRGYVTQILTHHDDATENLFAMAKRYHDACPSMFRPETGASNAKELAFSKLGSGYRVATAGGRAVGRSSTIQLFHGSEVGFWPNAEEHFAGIMQALSNAHDTECILESTANGIGNVFHRLWKAAELGDSEFEAIFLPWFWHEEYRAPEPDGWRAPDAWEEYAETYGLDRDQVYWAFVKNRDLSVVGGGSPEEINWKFRQEYPANANEAFQTSGQNAFIAPEVILAARKRRVTGYGPIILGVDPARGGGDKTGIIDRQGRVAGGHVCKRVDNSDLMSTAGEILHIANSLRSAGLRKVVIDTTGLGAGLYDRLRETLPGMVEGVNFGAKAYDADHYVNRRSEMWDTMREWMDDPAGVQIPDNDELHGDLAAPMRGPGATRFDSVGRLILEPKDHIRERLSFSPDLGDALALTFAAGQVMVQPQTEHRRARIGMVA